MFACLFLPPVPLSSAAGRFPSSAREGLVALAREFSPRVDARGSGLVVLDVSGLDRLLGDAWAIGRELRRAAADRGLAAHVAVAATRSAAMLLACGRAGLTVARPGEEPRLLADLPLSVLERLVEGTEAAGAGRRPRASPSWTPCDAGSASTDDPLAPGPWSLAPVFRRWGLRTLGELAALPPAALSERLGQDGVWWQRLARGEDAGPLVPDLPERRYEASLDLEWPIEGLEPLSFVFARLFEPLSAELARDDRAAAVLRVAYTLVTREVDTRTLQLPAPMRDPRVLRTLVLLNLEGHPVTAGIDRIAVTAEPAPGRIVQFSLLGRALPVPEQLAPLVARLGALVGEDRVGAAALVDSHRPGAFCTEPFTLDPVARLDARATGAGRRPQASRPLSTADCLPSGSCPGDGHLPLRLGMSLDSVARLDARSTGAGRRPRASPSWTPSAAGLSSTEAVGVQDGRVPPSPTADRRPTPQVSMPCRLSPSIARSATVPPQSPHSSQRDRCDQLAPGPPSLAPDSLPTVHDPLSTVLRRFRIPVPARVQVKDGAPVRVMTERVGLAGGRVERSAGPWRTSGEWWQLADARLQPRADGRLVQVGWNRDEWDVALSDGGIYRIYRDRHCDRWFVDGIVD